MGSRRTPADPAADTAAAEGKEPPAAQAAVDAAAHQQHTTSGCEGAADNNHLQQHEQQPFVNTGLLTWLERRREWTQKPPDFKRTARKRAYSPAVTAEQVLSFTPFPKPVALQDVIEVLQEVWEQEEYF